MSFLKQALLVAATAIAVAVFPSFYKPSFPVPEIFGTVAPGFEEVRDVFRENYEKNWDNREAGSAFSVYYKGENVVDLWAGYADAEAKRLWKEDTMVIIFSSTKGLTALCVAMLADSGYLDFKKPVSHYWPEFSQNGKELITVEQLLEHEAGLASTGTVLTYDILKDHAKIDSILAKSKPQWDPGTRHGYHGMTMGPLVDALFRRVDPKGRTVGQFFDEEVRQPFGIDAYIGVPLELDHRIGRSVNVQGTFNHYIYALRSPGVIRDYMLMSLSGGSNSLFQETIDKCGDICEFDRMADPEIRKIEVASVNGVATARALAKLYGILANGGKQGNKTLLSQKLLEEYINDKRGLTPDLVLFDYPLRWKYGMNVIPQGENAGNLFGSAGAGGQVGYADPNNNLGYGFVSRYMSPMAMQLSDPRFKNLHESVLRVIKRRKDSKG